MKINHWSLNNGARCVIAEMENSPLTCINFWCKGGSVYETKEEEGMAHFLEHMIFKGSKNLSEGEFDLKIESLGGSSNAATGLDDVNYHILIPPQNLEKALVLLLDLILFPKIESKAFEIEKQVVLEEIGQTFDQPEEMIFMNLFKNCWLNHRYSSHILGNQKTIKILKPNEMKSFHKRQYNATNCTLSIAGEIPKNIYSTIEESELGKLKATAQEKDLSNKPIFQKGYQIKSFPRLEGARILKAWELPPAKEQLTLLGVEIATTLLCEGRNSILVKKLREELRIIESIDMDLHILEKGGLILLEACCQLENINNIENEINIILNDLIHNICKNKDLERAKTLVINNFYYGIEISSQIASLTGNQMLWGRQKGLLDPIKEIQYWTKSKLNKLIFPLFNPENSYTLIAKPK